MDEPAPETVAGDMVAIELPEGPLTGYLTGAKIEIDNNMEPGTWRFE